MGHWSVMMAWVLHGNQETDTAAGDTSTRIPEWEEFLAMLRRLMGGQLLAYLLNLARCTGRHTAGHGSKNRACLVPPARHAACQELQDVELLAVLWCLCVQSAVHGACRGSYDQTLPISAQAHGCLHAETITTNALAQVGVQGAERLCRGVPHLPSGRPSLIYTPWRRCLLGSVPAPRRGRCPHPEGTCSTECNFEKVAQVAAVPIWLLDTLPSCPGRMMALPR